MADPRDVELRDAVMEYLSNPPAARRIVLDAWRDIASAAENPEVRRGARGVLRVLMAVEAFGADVRVCAVCHSIVPTLATSHACPELARA